jgi:purine-nucleoside/S-methyl-5'-thioadenosine phosphorylase / adenosine deaminase
LTDTFLQSELLLKYGAINGVSLRVETKPALFGMKRSGTDTGPEAENRKEFYGTLGFEESQVVRGQQVHGDNVAVVNSAATFPNTDSLLTQRRNLLLAISIADCVPVLIFDKNGKAVAAVHSGWKGTAKNVTGKTVNVFRDELNSNPEDLIAFVGPSAGSCCYEVGEDVARHFAESYRRSNGVQGKYNLDLKRAIESQLIEAGVLAGNIEVSDRCTICDLNFHSYRRDGEASGRMLAAVAIK